MYIYKTTNLLNGKIYIGLSTKSVEGHNWYKGSGRLILAAIDKYGKENFSKEILECNISDIEELKLLEKFYIKEYNSRDRTTGYNIAPGGIRVPTKEALAKRSHSLKGRKHSEDTKEKIRQSTLGRVHSDEHRSKISKGLGGTGIPVVKTTHMTKTDTGWKHNHTTLDKMRKKATGRKHSPETIAKMKASAKARWSNAKKD